MRQSPCRNHRCLGRQRGQLQDLHPPRVAEAPRNAFERKWFNHKMLNLELLWVVRVLYTGAGTAPHVREYKEKSMKTPIFITAMSLAASLALGTTTLLAATAAPKPAIQHTISLSAVSAPKDTLSKAKIEDTMGNSVGSVDQVILDKKGRPISLKVDVGGFLGVGDRDVAMKASAFKFDPDRKVLVTSMTKDQIKKLPALKS